jgi:hypothetical protein
MEERVEKVSCFNMLDGLAFVAYSVGHSEKPGFRKNVSHPEV